MLLSLQIENFALVDRLELALSKGLTVMTGETGAGKSIILDAIDAVLGGKVTNRAIRTGAERALVEATFQLDAELADWLKTQAIELTDPNTFVCSREITLNNSSQRSRSRINGTTVNKQQMEHLRDRLVEITAQGQTVQIGQPPLQREWLDSYGGEELLKQRTLVANAFANFQQAAQALEKRRKSEQERLQQLDLFDYQIKDLKAANLSDPDELEQLEQERKRLSHSVELQQQSYQVYQILYENEGEGEACIDLLGKTETILQSMVEYDVQVQPILELVSNALAQIQEAGQEINTYGEALEADPQRLQAVQERITELKQICRKYGPGLGDAIALYQRLLADLEELTGGGQSLEELEQAAQERQEILNQECAHLTKLRQTTAAQLEERLVEELKPLAMEKVQFKVQIAPTSASALGADQITFLFSPNPGEPLQPLTEIASGGEMSRFLLALQASFSKIDPVGTLVFDEIDVGVSGRVTQAIAEKLYQLSQHHQVLCVTHQAMVAAMADHHLHVSKQVIDSGEPILNGKSPKNKGKADKANSSPSSLSSPVSPAPDVRTVVRVTSLDTEQRQEELAQLAGGQTAQEAIAFANSLLNQATTLRQAIAGTPSESAETTSSEVSKSRTKTSSAKTKAAIRQSSAGKHKLK